MADNGLIWKNLLRDLCPRCNEALYKDGTDYRCSGSHCLFWLSAGRRKWLVNGMQNAKRLPTAREDELKTLHDLN